MMQICRNCGAEMGVGERCPYCGTGGGHPTVPPAQSADVPTTWLGRLVNKLFWGKEEWERMEQEDRKRGIDGD